MEQAIERLTILCILIIGLSHILQPRAWADFFIRLRETGKYGVFVTAFIHLPLGALIVSFHNVWSGVPVIITIFGWGQVIKSTLYFLFPRIGLWSLSRVSIERSSDFAIAGAVFVVLCLILAYSLFFA